MHLFGALTNHLLQAYGYWAVFGLVLLETTGIPSPGETALITAAAYAGSTHRLSVFLVVGAAVAAAILGDNLGFLIGREGGWRLLRRYGRAMHIEDWIVKVGVYLFHCHGAKIVFFGRFIPIFRTYGALLAGVNRYRWRKFLIWNALGGIAWACMWGAFAYAFGKALQSIESMVSLIALAFALAITVAAGIAAKRKAKELRSRAERAFPGDLAALDRA